MRQSNRWLVIADRIDSCTRVVAVLARWSVLLMLGLGLWNVVGRYLGVVIGMNLSSNGLIEGQWYFFDFVFLLGLSWTLQRNNHVRVDVLQNRWSLKAKTRAEFLGTVFLLLPFALGVMLISLGPAIHSWTINELSPDPDGLPRYWIKSLIPVGFFFLSLQGISKAIRSWFALKSLSFQELIHEDSSGEES